MSFIPLRRQLAIVADVCSNIALESANADSLPAEGRESIAVIADQALALLGDDDDDGLLAGVSALLETARDDEAALHTFMAAAVERDTFSHRGLAGWYGALNALAAVHSATDPTSWMMWVQPLVDAPIYLPDTTEPRRLVRRGSWYVGGLATLGDTGDALVVVDSDGQTFTLPAHHPARLSQSPPNVRINSGAPSIISTDLLLAAGTTLPDSLFLSGLEALDVIRYLSEAVVLRSARLPVHDDFDGTVSIPDMWYSDGTYVWHQKLSYYVDEHNLGLPDEFVQHIKAACAAPRTISEERRVELTALIIPADD